MKSLHVRRNLVPRASRVPRFPTAGQRERRLWERVCALAETSGLHFEIEKRRERCCEDQLFARLDLVMSSKDIFAEAMLDTEEYLEKYKQQLIELDDKNLLPQLDLKLKYKVYAIRGSGFGAHKSIVLTTNDENFVTVELGSIKVDGVKRIYPVTKTVDKSLKAKMEYLGEIQATGQELIGKAVAVMKKFGSYFKLCNNCQDFCNMYAEAIGLKHVKKLTDGDKAAIVGLLAAIIAFLFALR